MENANRFFSEALEVLYESLPTQCNVQSQLTWLLRKEHPRALEDAFHKVITAAFIYSYHRHFTQVVESFSLAIDLKRRTTASAKSLLQIQYDKLQCLMSMKPSSTGEVLHLTTTLKDILSHYEQDLCCETVHDPNNVQRFCCIHRFVHY